MNILVTYYLFLVAGAVLLVALRDSPQVQGKRNPYLSYVLLPPLILVIGTLKLGFLVTSVLVLAILLLVDRLLRANAARDNGQATFRLWLIVWLIEGVLPLSLHFALSSRPDVERWFLLATGSVLFVGALMTFLVFAPDLRKKV